MKHIVITALALLLCFNAFSQNTTHLDLWGIPIAGNITDFSKQLVQKGFKQVDYSYDPSESSIIYKGKFPGDSIGSLWEGDTIIVTATYFNDNKRVYKVAQAIAFSSKSECDKYLMKQKAMYEERYKGKTEWNGLLQALEIKNKGVIYLDIKDIKNRNIAIIGIEDLQP